GAGAGHELLFALRMTQEVNPPIPHHATPIFLVEPELEGFVLLLHLHDLGAELGSGRLFCFVGEGALTAWEAFWREERARPPLAMLAVPGREAVGEAFLVALTRVQRENHLLRQSLQGEVDRAYAARTVEARRGMGNHPGALRVMILSSRFTTYLQYSARDLREGFAALGAETRLLMEPDAVGQLGPLAVTREVAAFRPDLVVLINHFRQGVWAGCFPPELPVATWVQDVMPWILDPSPFNLGEEDYLFSFASQWREGLFQTPAYRGRKVGLLPVGINPRLYHPLPGVEKTVDLLCVSHLRPPEQTLEPFRRGGKPDFLYPGERAALGGGAMREEEMVRLYRGAADFLDGRSPFGVYHRYAHAETFEGLIREILAETGFADRWEAWSGLFYPTIASRLVMEILDQVKRQPVRYLVRHGIRPALFGNHWGSYPDLAPFARGTAENGAVLNEWINRSRICLNNSPGTGLHMFTVEVLGAGGFLLSREIPPAYDTMPLAYCLKPGEEAVMFRESEDLLERVRYFLEHDEEREEMARRGHGRAMATLTYDKLALEMLRSVGEGP
ncbi:MAG: glycosyltransferase family 1 protein, partial [Magnetococcales bacterium]|nr:glycosyltransferase family 1 protein [Magnetococcales bacterium]